MNVETSLLWQFGCFLLCGVFLSVGYEFFRIIRIVIPHNNFCELRSGRYNINPIAVKYGGGGHAKASGATLPDRAAAMAMLEDLDALMKEQSNESC